RLAFFHAYGDIRDLDEVEAGGIEALADIVGRMGETLVRPDHEGAVRKGFRRKRLGGKDEVAAGHEIVGDTEEQRFEGAEIGQDVRRGDEIEGLVFVVVEEIDGFGNVERLV